MFQDPLTKATGSLLRAVEGVNVQVNEKKGIINEAQDTINAVEEAINEAKKSLSM